MLKQFIHEKGEFASENRKAAWIGFDSLLFADLLNRTEQKSEHIIKNGSYALETILAVSGGRGY